VVAVAGVVAVVVAVVVGVAVAVAVVVGVAVVVARYRSMTDYDPLDDAHKSVAEAFRIIRKRVAAGGPGWTPHKYHPLCEGCCEMTPVRLNSCR